MWDDNKQSKEQLWRHMLFFIIVATMLFFYMNNLPKPQPPSPEGGQPAVTTEQPAAQEFAVPLAATTSTTVTQDTGWPYLPPLPIQDDPGADEVFLENESLRLVFTRVGARLKEATAIEDDIQFIPSPGGETPDSEAVYPLGLTFTDAKLGNEVDRRRFEVVEETENSVTFELALGEAGVLRKTFRLGSRPHVMDVEVTYENREDSARRLGLDATPAYILNWGPDIESGDKTKIILPTFVTYAPEQRTSLRVDKMDYERKGKFLDEVTWAGVKTAYFVVALKPEFEGSRAWAAGNPKKEQKYRFGVAAPMFVAEAGETRTHTFSLYIGPNQAASLDVEGWESLVKMYRIFEGDKWSWMDKFARMFLSLMNWFHNSVCANYGLAIIFVTIIVRVVMYPLTLKSMKSMKRMQSLAPEIEALKEKYGENQQELSAKTMELYKERGVNPVGGCFPMLLQMPVFIAFYRMIACAYELRGAPFMLWITDLSQPDQMFKIPFQIPFFDDLYFNLIPILMGLAMVLNQKMMPATGPSQNPQQKMMMTFMPIIFCVICYNMAAGTSLYILTSTVLGMVQQKFINMGADTEAPKKIKKTVGKKQHFYTAAMARKRQDKKGSKRK